MAQRDILKKQKEEKRLEELEEFNKKLGLEEGSAGQKSLFEQFKAMDDTKKIPAGMQPVKMNTFVDPALERRRQIYKNVR